MIFHMKLSKTHKVIILVLASAIIWTGPIYQALSTPKPIAFSSTDMRDMALKTESGEQRLSDFKGQVIVLNFWAAWCGPCVKEMPSLDELQSLYKDQGLKVIAASIEGLDKAKIFYERMELTHLEPYIMADPNDFAILGLNGLPNTILINREGKRVATIRGFHDWTEPSTVAAIESLLSDSKTISVVQ